MKRIETTLAQLKTDIRNFYDPGSHHFMVMNAVDLGEKIELQWFFSDYAAPYETTVFTAQVQPDVEIPTVRDIIPSAWVAEAELADLMDIRIEQAVKGFVLEPDFESGPLRKKK